MCYDLFPKSVQIFNIKKKKKKLKNRNGLHRHRFGDHVFACFCRRGRATCCNHQRRWFVEIISTEEENNHYSLQANTSFLLWLHFAIMKLWSEIQLWVATPIWRIFFMASVQIILGQVGKRMLCLNSHIVNLSVLLKISKNS